MNKKILIISLIVFLGLSVAIYQYAKEFQSEFTSAAYSTSKPANGHSWSEMECTSDLCIVGGKVGIGIEPIASSKKLNVVGDVEATGSVKAASLCLGSTGACISDVAAFLGALLIAGGNDHNQGACTSTYSINGTTYGVLITQPGLSYPICQFVGASCPSGWSKYRNWSTSPAGTRACEYCNGPGSGIWLSETWPGYVWGNNNNCTTLYGGCHGSTGSCAVCAAITQIGCY